jgi:integrase
LFVHPQYRGFPQPNPFALVDEFAHDVKSHYVPPERDFWKVVSIAEGQDEVMLLTFLYTAARRGEIFRLKWEDVVFDSHEPRIALKTRKRKGGSLETNWIPMIPALVDLLKDHQKQAINQWVFVAQEQRHFGRPFTVRRHFPSKLCKEAEVKRFGCHGIRALSASILAKEGTPMKVIQQLLRHKSLATTERYVRNLAPIRPYLQVLEGGKRRVAA